MSPEIPQLIGKTFSRVTTNVDTLDFIQEDGSGYRFYHSQECCENVSIAEIIGDLSNLVGCPIRTAIQEELHNENPPDVPKPEYVESFTWTTLIFTTDEHEVRVRWYGESNGYYSESVSLTSLP